MAHIAISLDENADEYDEYEVPEEAARVVQWLMKERKYQLEKWGAEGDDEYTVLDEAHALQGLDDDSWFWERGVLNYTGRVRLHGVTSPLGVQALLKLCTTLLSMPEHLLRGEHVDGLPTPGLSSGNLE